MTRYDVTSPTPYYEHRACMEPRIARFVCVRVCECPAPLPLIRVPLFLSWLSTLSLPIHFSPAWAYSSGSRLLEHPRFHKGIRTSPIDTAVSLAHRTEWEALEAISLILRLLTLFLPPSLINKGSGIQAYMASMWSDAAAEPNSIYVFPHLQKTDRSTIKVSIWYHSKKR